MSLRARLLLVLISATLVTSLTATGATYYWASREIDRLFDYQLRQQALALRDKVYGSSSFADIDPDPDQHIVIQVWDRRGTRLYLSHRTTRLPQLTELGYGTVTAQGEDWRTYAIALGPRVIQVAQPMSKRRDIATDAALRILYPTVAVVPILAAFIWWLVGYVLSPLSRLARTIAMRQPQALEIIPDHNLPLEAGLMVAALNDLIERLRRVLDRQRQFMADAAHELRTPLTAVHLQTQLLERAASEAERAEAITALKQGVQRSTQLAERLLTLARLEADTLSPDYADVDLSAVAQQVVAELKPLAESRSVQLDLSVSPDAVLEANQGAMYSLLSNLVENALRYSSSGGTVQVAVQAEPTQIRISVTDNGPGIPESERKRIFDRFYRLPGTESHGSGLGLAIVRRVVDLHQGSVAVDHGPYGTGACFLVQLPKDRQQHRHP